MKERRYILLVLGLMIAVVAVAQPQHKTLREWGFPTGIFSPGPYNAITDVPGVTVGHVTLIEGDSISFHRSRARCQGQ